MYILPFLFPFLIKLFFQIAKLTYLYRIDQKSSLHSKQYKIYTLLCIPGQRGGYLIQTFVSNIPSLNMRLILLAATLWMWGALAGKCKRSRVPYFFWAVFVILHINTLTV